MSTDNCFLQPYLTCTFSPYSHLNLEVHCKVGYEGLCIATLEVISSLLLALLGHSLLSTLVCYRFACLKADMLQGELWAYFKTFTVVPTGADSGIVAIESLHTAQHTLGREVGATLSSHHSVAKGDTFVASVMKPTQSSGHRVLVKDETVADSVAGLYDVFKEDDITASTSGEDVREQQHGGSGSVGESEEVEDNAEVGFFMTSSEERKLEGKSHTEAQADEGQKGSLVHQGVNLKVSNASSSSNPAQQLSREHLRIFVADLGPKYNLEIFEALHGIDDSTAEVCLQLF